MRSFYGGKKGAPFILVRSYTSIAEMKADFEDWTKESSVHFDEYVLINTENKNNIENGRVYRRGYNTSATDELPLYNSEGVQTGTKTVETGGGEYVGTIVGPAGPAPTLELTSMDDVAGQAINEGVLDTNGNLTSLNGQEAKYATGEYNISDGNIVLGKDVQDGVDVYNDSIEWNYLWMRDSNNVDTVVLFGFKFPCLVIDFVSTPTTQYDASGNRFIPENTASRVDDGSHPFYEKWDVKSLTGIKGDAFKDFRVIEASIYDGVEPYEGQGDDRNNGREILVFDYYCYDNKQTGEPKTLYLGDYNMIESVTLDEYGSFKIQYTHEDRLEKIIKWVDGVTLDDEGTFTVTYNTKDELLSTESSPVKEQYVTELKWPTDITLSNDGNVDVSYTIGNDETIGTIRWIDSLTFNPSNGTFTVDFNNGMTQTETFEMVTDITIEDTGEVYLHKTTDTLPEGDLIQNIKWLEDISMTDDHRYITTRYNYMSASDEPDFLNEQPLKFVDEIYIRPLDGQLMVKYNTTNPGEGEDKDNPTQPGEWTPLGVAKSYDGVLIGLTYSDADNDELEILPEGEPVIEYGYDGAPRQFDIENAEVSGRNIKISTTFTSPTYSEWYFVFTASNISDSLSVSSTEYVTLDSNTSYTFDTILNCENIVTGDSQTIKVSCYASSRQGDYYSNDLYYYTVVDDTGVFEYKTSVVDNQLKNSVDTTTMEMTSYATYSKVGDDFFIDASIDMYLSLSSGSCPALLYLEGVYKGNPIERQLLDSSKATITVDSGLANIKLRRRIFEYLIPVEYRIGGSGFGNDYLRLFFYILLPNGQMLKLRYLDLYYAASTGNLDIANLHPSSYVIEEYDTLYPTVRILNVTETSCNFQVLINSPVELPFALNAKLYWNDSYYYNFNVSNSYEMIFSFPKTRSIIEENNLVLKYTTPSTFGSMQMTFTNDVSFIKEKFRNLTFEKDTIVIQFLNTKWPDGLVGVELEGKVVAVLREGQPTALFAFDYNTDERRGWKKIGELPMIQNQISTFMGPESMVEELRTMPEGSVLFIIGD